MRILLLLSVLACHFSVNALEQVDQTNVTSDDLSDDESSEQCEFADDADETPYTQESDVSSNQAVITITTLDEASIDTASSSLHVIQASVVDTMQGYAQQLMTHLKPFGVGVIAGASLGCLETEIINPIVSYLLASFKSDVLVVTAEAGIVGGAAYTISKNQNGQTGQDSTKPATLVGVLAGLIAWYALHG